MAQASETSYLVATDVGGTCTDTILFGADDEVVLGKSLSTPPDFAQGVLDSVANAAAKLGLDVAGLLARTSLFVHGSTVVDNTILTRDGARTGLLATAGFEDTILVTRGAYGRWGGLPEERMKHPVATDRPPALVEPSHIEPVTERIDYKGAVIEPLDEAMVERAVRRLVDTHAVEAIAVSLLWSFYNPVHEQRIREIIERVAPDLYVTLSSEIAPVPGEYERTSTTVINAYAGSITRAYLTDLAERLAGAGYQGPILVMQGYGGLLAAEKAAERAVGMIESGPAAGVIGAKYLGDMMGDREIIAADMGGTTFKVGIIQNGELDYAREPMVDRFHYVAPKIEVVSIGSGGGSIISLDPQSGTPRVGPRSAGARPGPVCYGQGGTEPTLTDVMTLIGYMSPDSFLGGSIKLDIEAARVVFKRDIADPLGLSVEEAAFGIYRIAAAQITDLIHEITVERGLDPRDFVLHAFGGTCGFFCGMFGQELNVRRVIIPYTASVNCAFGLVSADIVHEFSATKLLAVPSPADEVTEIFRPMVAQALDELRREGFDGHRVRLDFAVDLRYGRQVHEVTTRIHAPMPLDEDGLARLVADFEALYERRYGRGSAYRGAGIEMTRFRLTARGLLARPGLKPQSVGEADAESAILGTRPMFDAPQNRLSQGTAYDFDRLRPGMTLNGPAVIHSPITTIVVQSGQSARMDAFRNIVISFA